MLFPEEEAMTNPAGQKWPVPYTIHEKDQLYLWGKVRVVDLGDFPEYKMQVFQGAT